MDANYGSGNNYGQNYSVVGQNGARTTTFKFNGVEDMGKGLKAKFQFEVQPSIIAGDGNGFNNAIATAGAVSANGTANATGQASAQSGLVGKGQSYVAAESAQLGEIQFGTINTATLANYLIGSQAWGTGIGSGYGVIQGSTGTNTLTRFENSFMYSTPEFAGFKARYLANSKLDSQMGATTGATLRRPGVSEIGLSYSNGPLKAGYSRLAVKSSPNEAAGSNNVNTNTITLAGSYDLKVASIGLSKQDRRDDAATPFKTTSTMVSVVGPLGQYRLMANTGYRKTDASSVAAIVDGKTTFTGLGAEYDLSKRTFVYARMQRGNAGDVDMTKVIINGAAGANNAAQDRNYNLSAIGISHAF